MTIEKRCELRAPGYATAQQPLVSATGGATLKEGNGSCPPMTGRELRAQLRMQHTRNNEAKGPDGGTDDSCASSGDTHYRWRVTGARCGVYEVCFLPEATHAEVSALYPGAAVKPMQCIDDTENTG